MLIPPWVKPVGIGLVAAILFAGGCQVQKRMDSATLERTKADYAKKEKALADQNVLDLMAAHAAAEKADERTKQAEEEREKALSVAAADADRLRRKLAGLRIIAPVQAGPGISAQAAGSPDGSSTARELPAQVGNDLVGLIQECEGLRQRLLVGKAYAESIPQPK